MEGLPFLPGNTFSDVTKTKFHVSQSLVYKNGLAVRNHPCCAVGGMPLKYNNLSEEEMRELANYKPTLTYGQAKQAPPEMFIPAQVALDKKVLRFYCYMKEAITESPVEHYRVRHMDLYYYLEDDSIKLEEHKVKNMGMTQGVFINRSRLPKDDVGNHWTWKDLNNGVDITIYGRVFHLYNCDKFTSDWLESEGIIVNEPECAPDDPYILERTEREAMHLVKTPSDFDKLRQFLEMDRKVLRFYAVWDDRDLEFGDIRKFIILYYLVDDTLEVREVHTENSGRDPFPVLIIRHRCPKDRYDINPSFPVGVMETTPQEHCCYYTPVDFKIGCTLLIYNRRFLIYDIDNFTRAFYWKNFGMTDFTPIDVNTYASSLPKKELPPYNLHGSLEDSMQNVLMTIPEQPKIDLIKMLENQGKVLRYEAFMDSTRRSDRYRRFIIQYFLADDTMSIYEPPVNNSGIAGGKFLAKTRVGKPGSPIDKPDYYGPQDFIIGKTIEVFRHRFLITKADKYVLKYAEQHPNDFSEEVIKNLKENLEKEGEEDCENAHYVPSREGPMKFNRSDEDDAVGKLVHEVRIQLQKLSITGSPWISHLFRTCSTGNDGYISKKNLMDLCVKHQLPADCDVIDCLARQMAKDPNNITLQEFRDFLQSSV